MTPNAAIPGTSIGLVGCGRWGRHVLRDLVSLGCKVWVVAQSPASRQNARQFGAHRVVGEISDLPLHLQGYVVAVPTCDHAAVIHELPDRQRPVFVEKPMTCSVASAEELVSEAGDRLYVMDKWRHHPAIEAMAGLVQSGELGRLLNIRTWRTQWGNPHEDVDAIWILLPHELSIVLHVLGELPDPVWALGEWVSDDSLISMVGQLGSDPSAVVEVSVHDPQKQCGVVVSCEKGTAMMADPLADHVLLRRGSPGQADAPLEKIAVSTEFPLLRELRSFVAHIHGGGAPHSSAAEGLRVVRTIERMRALARQGQRVCR